MFQKVHSGQVSFLGNLYPNTCGYLKSVLTDLQGLGDRFKQFLSDFTYNFFMMDVRTIQEQEAEVIKAAFQQLMEEV